MKPQLFSGPRGKITFKDSNGNVQVLALITDVSLNESPNLRPTYVIGSMNPTTIEPLSIDVSGSIGRIIPINQATSSEALANVTSIDFGIEERINAILSADSVEITIMDRNPSDLSQEKIIATLKHARFAGRSTSMNAGDIASERYNFVAIWDGGYGGDSNIAESINYGFEET